MPKIETDNSLCNEIIRLGIVDEQRLNELQEQCAKSGKNIITYLKENHLATDEQLGKLVAQSQKIEFINLSPDMVESIAAHMIPYELSNEHNLIGVRMEADKLYVAMSSPMNLAVRDQIP